MKLFNKKSYLCFMENKNTISEIVTSLDELIKFYEEKFKTGK
jgi:hypothetical protein